MKKTTKFISAALAAVLCAGLLAGCNSASSSSGSTSASGSASASASASASSSTSAGAESIDYSKGLAENGHIDGVTALDYVTLPADYAAIPLAAGTADVSDEDVQAQIDSIMAQYAIFTKDKGDQDTNKLFVRLFLTSIVSVLVSVVFAFVGVYSIFQF